MAKMTKTLITGASSGIGKALAHEFARNGHELLLVARDAKKLEDVAQEIRRTYSLEVSTLSIDLSTMEGPQALYDEVQKKGLHIETLVNDASVGLRTPFAQLPMEKLDKMIHLNIRAYAVLTRLFLGDMLARKSGRILEVGSIAGFLPGPLMATYHATKAFVVSLSASIQEEIKESDVTLSCLCPGPVDTPFFERANMTNARAHKIVMQPEDVAKAAYEGLMAGVAFIVPGASNKALLFSSRFTPIALQAKAGKKLYESGKE